MAFVDKINSMANKLVDKTEDMIEIGKLEVEIGKEKNAIDDAKVEIADYYLEKSAKGEKVDAKIASQIKTIDDATKRIKKHHTQIEKIKAAKKNSGKTTGKSTSKTASKTTKKTTGKSTSKSS